ncbi:AbrB family transcriptional regulator, partial [Pseudomonas fulva]|nr:AbrB family transcriptional regulator [Pseudomonas fulva]
MPDRALPLYWATGLVGLSGGFAASKVGWAFPGLVGALMAINAVRCQSPWQLPEIPKGR